MKPTFYLFRRSMRVRRHLNCINTGGFQKLLGAGGSADLGIAGITVCLISFEHLQ